MAVNLNSKKYEHYIRALLVGATGRGKTIAATSWPGKTLILDFDGRHRPVIDWHADRVTAGDFTVEEVTAENFWKVFQPLVVSLAQFNPYQNILLDGVTSLSTSTVIMQMMAKGGFRFFNPKEKNEGVKVVSGGVQVPSWDEFNGEAMVISTLLESLRSLKCNFFLTAHPVQRTAIENKKATKYTSITTFGPKIESIIPTYFDEVWFFDYKLDYDQVAKQEVIRRTCYTQPQPDYMEAKSALKMPATIDYTGKNLYDCVKPYLNETAAA